VARSQEEAFNAMRIPLALLQKMTLERTEDELKEAHQKLDKETDELRETVSWLAIAWLSTTSLADLGYGLHSAGH
jgi:hypothetical protein